MRLKGFRILIIAFLLGGCNVDKFHGQLDSPIEYLPYINEQVTEEEYDKLISFLWEAEVMMHKPLDETYINEDGVKVFPTYITNKNDLFEYFQVYLSNELAATLARKVSDLSRSKDNQYLAVSNHDLNWFSIKDADVSSIRIIHHTTVQSVVEMMLEANNHIRLQYTIMKDQLGNNPKIVQKTVQYE